MAKPLSLNVQLGPEFTLVVVNKSEPFGSDSLSVDIKPAQEILTLVAGIRSSSLSTGGGSSFLPTPDMISDTDTSYFYWGWISVNNGWLIRRTTRATAQTNNATMTGNPSYANLTQAWTERTNLTYI